MPKKIDHKARRDELARIAYEVILKSGLKALTQTRMAKETGRSVGALTAYVPSKDQLLILAADYITRPLKTETLELLDKYKGLEGLRRLLYLNLPQDRKKLARYRICFGLYERVEGNPKISARLESHYSFYEQHYSALIIQAQKAAEVSAAINVSSVAKSALALLDGIAIRCILGKNALPSRAQEILLEEWIKGMLQPTNGFS